MLASAIETVDLRQEQQVWIAFLNSGIGLTHLTWTSDLGKKEQPQCRKP
jgi:hypothetical protein